MIVADFSRNEKGFRLHIEGHAEYSSSEDIICAATSGIFYALCGYLYNFKRDSVRVNCLDNGCADLECGEECESYLQMTCLGLFEIARAYPENIAVINRAWAWKMLPRHNTL